MNNIALVVFLFVFSDFDCTHGSGSIFIPRMENKKNEHEKTADADSWSMANNLKIKGICNLTSLCICQAISHSLNK